jgi:hypothetical protein
MRVVCAILLFAAGCRSATPSAGAPPATERVRIALDPTEGMDITRDREVRSIDLSASRDRVWSALMATHDAIGTTPSVLDAGAGTASFIHQNSRRLLGKPLSEYVDCGRSTQGARADIYNVTLRVNQALRSQNAMSTTVHTVVTASARPLGMTGDAVQCYTLGTLERKIGEVLLMRLKS